MATKFVNSGAAGANNGTSWTDAWTSLASSNGVAAGDIVKVHKTHSETTLAAAINWSNGTIANPVRIVCVDKDASDALATGAVVGWNATNLGPQGIILSYGCTWQTSGATLRLFPPSQGSQEYISSTLKTSSSGGLSFGDGGSVSRLRFRFTDCNIDFSGASAAGVTVTFAGSLGGLLLEWNGGTYTCRGTQTGLFTLNSAMSSVRIRGVNFSGTVTNIFTSTTASAAGDVRFDDCLAPTYTNVFSTAPTTFNARVNLDGLQSGTLSAALLQPVKQADLCGTIGASTSRYRTGGADDGSQANAHSWEIISNASAGVMAASIASPPITRWVAAGSQALKVYVASGGTLNDDEFWIEVLSPSEAGTPTPQGTFRSTRAAMLASPAALTTDGSSTWNGSGVGTKQCASVTIAPTVAGPVTIRVHLAKASTTVYVDPVIEVAGNVAGKSRFFEGAQVFDADGTGGQNRALAPSGLGAMS
jgi:hypothetical protein